MSATLSTSMSATMCIHVGRHVSHHGGHRNVVSTLCEVSETLTERKSKSVMDRQQTDGLTGVGARDTCVSKNHFAKVWQNFRNSPNQDVPFSTKYQFQQIELLWTEPTFRALIKDFSNFFRLKVTSRVQFSLCSTSISLNQYFHLKTFHVNTKTSLSIRLLNYYKITLTK